MKKRKKMAALILCACMSVTGLTGCSGKDEAANKNAPDAGGAQDGAGDKAEGTDAAGNAKGRFIEAELELPEAVNSLLGVRMCDDGSIVLVGYDENRVSLYRECSKDQGKSWEEVSIDYGNGNYSQAAVNPADGSAALIGYFNSNAEAHIGLAAPDGSVKELAITNMPAYEGDSGGDDKNMIVSAGYAGGKLFIVDLNAKIYEVDTAGGTVSDVSQSVGADVFDVIPLKDMLAVLTKSGVRLMDAAEGTILSEDAVLTDALGVMVNNNDSAIFGTMLTTGESAQEVYFVNHDGIFYHKQGGSTTEQLANGELMSVGDTSTAFRDLMRFDDEHFLVFSVDSLGHERCYSYAYDKDAPVVPEKQLSVYALEDSEILQQAVSMFRKQNQDVFVKKTVGMSGDDSVTAEDAIKTLNTQIMAGNGPDVLVLDGLPADSYIEKGILCDIADIVADADSADGLFTNITDAYQKDGGVYQVPLRFYSTLVEKDEGIGPVGGAPEELARVISELKEKDTPMLGAQCAEMLLYTIYDVYSASWKSADGIDEQALKSSLEAAKTLYDLDGYEEKERVPHSYSSDVWGLYQGQTLYGTVNSGSTDRVIGQARLSLGTLCGVRFVQDLYGIESAKPGSFELLCGEGQKTFGPFVCLGLTEAAKDNELAKDFLRTALSEEGQAQMTYGFSVNRKAYAAECENGKEYSIGGSGVDGIEFGYNVKKLGEEQKQALTEMLESLEVPIWNDRVVMDLVIGEGAGYLRGEKSLEDAVGAIVQKVRLYVSE